MAFRLPFSKKRGTRADVGARSLQEADADARNGTGDETGNVTDGDIGLDAGPDAGHGADAGSPAGANTETGTGFGERPGPGGDSRPEKSIQHGSGDDLVTTIAEAVRICADRKLDGWESLTLVFDIDGGSLANSGFLYKDGTVQAFSARLSENPKLLSGKVRKLSTNMVETLGQSFCQLLLQMGEEPGQIRIDFEFEDPKRWAVTSANLKAMRERLRPRF